MYRMLRTPCCDKAVTASEHCVRPATRRRMCKRCGLHWLVLFRKDQKPLWIEQEAVLNAVGHVAQPFALARMLMLTIGSVGDVL